VARVADLDRAAAAPMLRRLGEDASGLDLATLLQAWSVLAALASAAGPAEDPVPPDRLLAVRDGAVVRVAAADAVVVDHPAWLQRTDLGAAVIASGPHAADLAELLDLPLAAEAAPGLVDETGGAVTEVPDAVRPLLPAAPRTWCEHDELRVDGFEVDWWVEGGGPSALVHAATLDGLARGLAHAAGAWQLRGTVAAVLDGGTSLAQVLLDEALAPPRADT
jgi:hypothetical protein